jgi:hypothetical protein
MSKYSEVKTKETNISFNIQSIQLALTLYKESTSLTDELGALQLPFSFC